MTFPLRRFAVLVCLATALGGARTVAGAAGKLEHVPLLDNEACWKCLPKTLSGGGQPLPSWARALAWSLPRTTAEMLELDRLHRTRSPLGPELRGKMRWVAAAANRCEYSREYAEFDLQRAGIGEAAIAPLRHDFAGLPRPERAALEFARKMTLAANTVTDDEVAYLASAYGDDGVVAMVLLLAYANFQDRLLLALHLPIEPGGPLPPVEVVFDKAAPARTVPSRPEPKERTGPPVPKRLDDPEWLALNYLDLQRSLGRQRSSAGRIRVPSWEEVAKVLPAGYPRPKQPVRIRWSLVCMGYQPDLAAAWSRCTRAFGEEARQDRVFEESLFWVVTRTLDCFY